MATVPNLTLRYSHQVELVMPHRPDLRGFQVSASDTLDGAFAGATPMFEVRSGGTYRSPSIRARRLGLTSETNRGLTRVLYDPEDFWAGGATLPNDYEQGYVRVAEVAVDGTVGPQGPIYVVPPPGFLNTPRPALTLRGTAPSVTVPSNFLPPATAMHIVLPQFADNVRIQNLSTTDELLLAFGEGQPLITVPYSATAPSHVEVLTDGAFKHVFLCADGATPAFDLRVAIVNPEMS